MLTAADSLGIELASVLVADVARVTARHAGWVLVAGLCLGGLSVRTAYEMLKKAGRVDLENRITFGVVFAAMMAMLGSWPVLCAADPWRSALPTVVAWIGLGVVVMGVCLALGGLVQLRGLENIDHLVSAGLYARLRHPMYAGFTLWITGWVLHSGALASLVVGLVCIANVLYWRRLEETALLSRFGEDYRIYRQRTWF